MIRASMWGRLPACGGLSGRPSRPHPCIDLQGGKVVQKALQTAHSSHPRRPLTLGDTPVPPPRLNACREAATLLTSPVGRIGTRLRRSA